MTPFEIDLLKQKANSLEIICRLAEKSREDAEERAREYAEKVGILRAKLEHSEYRLEKGRREHALITGTYNPKWPEMNQWEIFQSFKETPDYIISITPKVEEDDILSFFKQSSSQI